MTALPPRVKFFDGLIALQDGEWIQPETFKFKCKECGDGIEGKGRGDHGRFGNICPNCCERLNTQHVFTQALEPGHIICWYCGLRKIGPEKS